ncbi:MAG TPA: ATP-binding cassette domain-containing protein, partial [Novosphingobium sp.]
MAAAPILSWEGLSLQQGSGWLFRDLDLHIAPRDRLALIGRNGAGKTTLLKLIAGLVEADRGKRSIQPGTRIVVLEQDPFFTGHATLMDFALHGPNAPARHEVEAIAGQLGIDMARAADSASGGERRRAALARALASDPDLLLLDEPTNHLDVEGVAWLADHLVRRHATADNAVVAITHDRW